MSKKIKARKDRQRGYEITREPQDQGCTDSSRIAVAMSMKTLLSMGGEGEK